MIVTLRRHGRKLLYSIALTFLASGIIAQTDEVAVSQSGSVFFSAAQFSPDSKELPSLISPELIKPPIDLVISSSPIGTSIPANGLWEELAGEKWLFLIALTLLISVVLNIVQFLRIVKLTHSSL